MFFPNNMFRKVQSFEICTTCYWHKLLAVHSISDIVSLQLIISYGSVNYNSPEYNEEIKFFLTIMWGIWTAHLSHVVAFVKGLLTFYQTKICNLWIPVSDPVTKIHITYFQTYFETLSNKLL